MKSDAKQQVTRKDLVKALDRFLRVLDERLEEDSGVLNDDNCATVHILIDLFQDIEDATIDLKESY